MIKNKKLFAEVMLYVKHKGKNRFTIFFTDGRIEARAALSGNTKS